jgi:arylsulfatase A-like enzyme
MSGVKRAGAAAVVAAAWAALATAAERELAVWAPPSVWWQVGAANFAVAWLVTSLLVALLRRRSARVLAGAQLAAIALSLALLPLNVRDPGPVIWVVCDTLRADRMSVYGHRRPTSPFLEEWAQELVVFDQAYSQASHTIVTAPSILASLYPSTHGLRSYTDVLDPDANLVSEHLQRAGYATFGAFSNPHLGPRNGFAQGWDHYLAPTNWGRMSSSDVNGAFFRWREKRKEDRTYFAMLWYIDPHTPFQWDEEAAAWARLNPRMTFRFKPHIQDETAPLKTRKQTARSYDAAVRSVDNSLKQLVEFLRDQNDYENALILFTSDHGESMWEHGRFGHNYGLYEHLTHVPLAIRFPAPLHFPATQPPRGRTQTIASSVDLLPTTLEFLGLPFGAEVQGRSLLPQLLSAGGGSAYLEQRLLRYGPYHIFGMREGRFKYIWVEEFEGDTQPRAMLFALVDDPAESRNLAASLPEVAAAFHARVLERRRTYEELALDTGRAAPDENTEALLEKLGYVTGDEHPSPHGAESESPPNGDSPREALPAEPQPEPAPRSASGSR